MDQEDRRRAHHSRRTGRNAGRNARADRRRDGALGARGRRRWLQLGELPLLRSLWHIANCRRHMPSSPVRSRTSSTSCFLCSEAGDCSTTTTLLLVGRTVRTCTVNRGRAGLPRITQLRSTGGEPVLTSTKSQSKPWRLYLDEQGSIPVARDKAQYDSVTRVPIKV